MNDKPTLECPCLPLPNRERFSLRMKCQKYEKYICHMGIVLSTQTRVKFSALDFTRARGEWKSFQNMKGKIFLQLKSLTKFNNYDVLPKFSPYALCKGFFL